MQQTAKIKSYAQAVTVNMMNSKKEMTDEIKGMEEKMSRVEDEVKSNVNGLGEALERIRVSLDMIENKIRNVNEELENINKKFVTHEQLKNHLVNYYVSAKQLSSLFHTVFQGIFSNDGLIPANGDYRKRLDRIIIEAIQFGNTGKKAPGPSPK